MCALLILNYVTHYEMRWYVDNVMNIVMVEVEKVNRHVGLICWIPWLWLRLDSLINVAREWYCTSLVLENDICCELRYHVVT